MLTYSHAHAQFGQVDRSVTGLVAQQQCVGPLHTPLANVAVVALSHFGGFSSGTAADGMPDAAVPGAATSMGEQPIIGLVDVSYPWISFARRKRVDPHDLTFVEFFAGGGRCTDVGWRGIDQHGLGTHYRSEGCQVLW